MDNRDECALLTRRLLIALLLIAAAFRSGSGLHAYTVDRQMDYSQFNRQCNGKSIKYLTDHAWKAVMRERYDSAAAYYSVAASRYSASLSDSDIYRCAIANVNIAYIWLSWRMNAAEAYPWLMKAQKIAELHGLRDVQSAVISNLGEIYFDYNNLPKARAYLLKAFEMVCHDKDDHYYGRSMVDYLTVAFYDDPVQISDSTISMICDYRINPDAPLAEYTVRMARTLRHFGNGELYEAALILDEATPLMRLTSDSKRYLAQHYLCLGRLWMMAREYTRASQALRSAVDISKREGMFNLLEKGYSLLEECARHNGDSELEDLYRHDGLHIRDSLFNASRFEQVKDLEMADQLSSLNESVRHASEKAESQRKRILLTSAFSIILIIVTIWIYIKHRHLREAYREIFKRNMELSEKFRPTVSHRPINAAEPPGAEPDQSGSPPLRSATPEEDEEMQTLMSRIRILMETDREIYNPDFSIERLAEMLGSREKLISQTINTLTGHNYNALLGEYRIREACRLLADPETLRSATMENVAEKVGYRSRTYFSTIFKNVTGLTPTQFVKQAREAAKKGKNV